MLVLVLMVAMSPVYLEQSVLPAVLVVPVSIALILLGSFVLYRLATILGLEASFDFKLKWDSEGDAGSLVRNADLFLVAGLTAIVIFLAGVLTSSYVEGPLRLASIVGFGVPYLFLFARYAFGRQGSIARRVANALSALLYFGFFLSILFFCILFIGVLQITGSYSLAAVVAGAALAIPLTLNRFYFGRIRKEIVEQSRDLAQALANHRRRQIIASVIVYVLLVDLPIAYWITTNSISTSLFIWMLGFVYYLAGSLRTGVAEITRMSLDTNLITEQDVRARLQRLRSGI
jgi:hypothetical protein